MPDTELMPPQNRTNGREADGRFAPGNPGGPGNPNGRRVAELRRAMFEAVTPADLRDVIQKLLAQAKAGDVESARLLLDRLLGRPVTPVIAEVHGEGGEPADGSVRIFIPENFRDYTAGQVVGEMLKSQPDYAAFLEWKALHSEAPKTISAEVVGKESEKQEDRK